MQGIAALTLATLMIGANVAAPAHAQSFGIFFGDERSDFAPQLAICLNDSQIRQRVSQLGYSDIYLNVSNNKRVQVRASKGGWVYLLKFNYCTGQIEERDRLRPVR